jgi:hypothetical protein
MSSIANRDEFWSDINASHVLHVTYPVGCEKMVSLVNSDADLMSNPHHPLVGMQQSESRSTGQVAIATAIRCNICRIV